MEALLVAWAIWGANLRGHTLRTMLGGFRWSPREIARDLGVAALFWMASMVGLAVLGIAWMGGEKLLHHSPPAAHTAATPLAPDPEQAKALRTMMLLAPETAAEMAGWALLCLCVGFSEELVFRGYLQQQFTALVGGRVVVGALVSAVLFGAAHGYQGPRNMVMLGCFGLFFSGLAAWRRTLRPAMMAHAWHDLFTGLMLAAIRSLHVV